MDEPRRDDRDDAARLEQSVLGLIARPEIGVWTAVFVAIGLVAAFALQPEDWSAIRTVAAGVIFGLACTFCLLLPRMIGGHDYN